MASSAVPQSASDCRFGQRRDIMNFDGSIAKPTRPHREFGTSKPACALRAHMFQAMTALDMLKVDAGNPAFAARNLVLLERIRGLMSSLSYVVPGRFAGIAEPEREKHMAPFRDCLYRVEKLAERGVQAIKSRDWAGARTLVNRIETQEHECHRRFAFPKYPGSLLQLPFGL